MADCYKCGAHHVGLKHKIDKKIYCPKCYNIMKVHIATIEANEQLQSNIFTNQAGINHLEWIYNRLINVHKEETNLDYMIKLKEIVDFTKSLQE